MKEKINGRIGKYSRRGVLSLLGVSAGVIPLASTTVADEEKHITLHGKSERTNYEITVGGDIRDGRSIEDGDGVSGQTASGTVRGGWNDDYFYTGDITEFSLEGDATVVIDGKEVDPDELGQTYSYAPEPFIKTDGTNLSLDGNAFDIKGGNVFWVSYKYWDRDVIEETLEELSEMGQNTLRVWGFGNGKPELFQPAPGVYNELAFERLDYVIKKAKEYDIRLIIPLSNYRHGRGGISQYVEWSDTAKSRDDFFLDENSKEMYKSYVEYVLTRTNTLTGMEYREDPTIMMWELMNEIQRPSSAEGSGEIVHSWVDEMAEFVKNIDDNHLLSTGAEGFGFGHEGKYDRMGYWMGMKGYDFVGIHESEHIDVASMHLYPDQWGISKEASNQFIEDRAEEASSQLGKPVYIGEFGKQVDRGSSDEQEQMNQRNSYYYEWYETMDDVEVDGALFYQLVPNSLASEGDNFSVFYPDDVGTTKIIEDGSAKL